MLESRRGSGAVPALFTIRLRGGAWGKKEAEFCAEKGLDDGEEV